MRLADDPDALRVLRPAPGAELPIVVVEHQARMQIVRLCLHALVAPWTRPREPVLPQDLQVQTLFIPLAYGDGRRLLGWKRRRGGAVVPKVRNHSGDELFQGTDVAAALGLALDEAAGLGLLLRGGHGASSLGRMSGALGGI